MILLDGLYINNSGGKVLLDYLVRELHGAGLDVFYLLDSRCKGSYPFLPEEKTLYLNASLKTRHRFYKANRNKFKTVLCFANIPPSIKLPAVVYTYFHNLLLAEQPAGYPFVAKCRAILKGLFIRLFKKNTQYFIVQSANVKKRLVSFLNLDEKECLVIPFFIKLSSDVKFSEKKEGFIYISNGNSHKNHQALLKAWELLFEKNVTPHLHLTVTDAYPALLELIEKYRSGGIKITNHGRVNAKDLYSNYKYSIYPSLIESFGLGLVESVDTDTEVIAADLPYVDAVISPAYSFDPYSPASIAEAVQALLSAPPSAIKSKNKVTDQIECLLNLLKG